MGLIWEVWFQFRLCPFLTQINVDLSDPVIPYLQNGEIVPISQGFVRVKLR